MPCVLPVISLKILSFVRQSHEHRSRPRAGPDVCGGILTFFGVSPRYSPLVARGGGSSSRIRRGGVGAGSGRDGFSLSLFVCGGGIHARVVNKLGEKAEGEGYPSAFFTGVLATFLGTRAPRHSEPALGAASRFQRGPGRREYFWQLDF